MDLALDCLTLTDTPPAEAIRAAGLAGYAHVSLWVQPPAAFARMTVTAANVAECARALAESGVACHCAEVFDLVSRENIAAARPALDLAARLGAKTALAIHYRNPDRAEVAGLLAEFAELAASYGMGVNVEPVAMAATVTLAQARDLIAASGADAGIVLDTWHFMRSGGTPADLAGIAPGLVRHVQVNDGVIAVPREAWGGEAMGERLYPGEGAFPLAAILAFCPRDIVWAIECPSLSRAAAGWTAQRQASETLAALREVIAALPD